MKFHCFLRATLLLAVFWCCSNGTFAQIYENTYSQFGSHDHYSITPSFTAGNDVVAGTLYNSMGGTDIQLSELADDGTVVWETQILTAAAEHAFHIEQDPHNPNNGYIISGIIQGQIGKEALFVRVDAGGNLIGQQCFAVSGWSDTFALHITPVEFANDPGYLVTGFVAQGDSNSSPKAGLATLLKTDLSIDWIRLFESPADNNVDWDMLSHGLEIPNSGLFVSGSSNGTSSQDALAAKLDYAGNLIWDESYYYDSTPNGDYNVAVSAVYDVLQDRVFQLVNLSETHSFAISAYDASAAVVTRLPEDMAFINGVYNNTAGYALNIDPTGTSLTVAGLLQDETVGTVSGSMPFQLNVRMDGTAINWQQLYIVPSPGYEVSTNLLDGFSAGQHPRILAPEMGSVKNTGNGYILNAYNFQAPMDPYDLEVIETDLSGKNACSNTNLGISFTTENWLTEHVISLTTAQVDPSNPSLSQTQSNADVSTCGSIPEACIPNPQFTAVPNPNDPCCYDFYPADPAATCLDWRINDAAGNNIYGSSGDNPLNYCFTADGTYEVCLTACCTNPDGSMNSAQFCQNIVIDCGGGCVVDPLFAYTIDADDSCCYTFNDLTPDPSQANCQNWEILDAAGNHILTGVFGPTLTYCFPADGTYTVCYMDCCTDPLTGVVSTATHCEEITVEGCGGCEPYDEVGEPILALIVEQECIFATASVSVTLAISIAPVDGYCVDFEYNGVIYNATYDAAAGFYTVTIDGLCDGDYEGTILVYCCDDASNVSSKVFNWSVATAEGCCQCTADASFSVDQTDECCYVFTDNGGFDSDQCDTWTITDAAGNVLFNTVNTDVVTYCFPYDGVYTVCHEDCCVLGDGQVHDTNVFCHEITVQGCGEPCVLPDESAVELVLVNTTLGCDVIGACVNYTTGLGLSEDYCIDWNWGDGTSQTNAANFCPYHTYAMDGVYTVCADVYCCDEPDVRLTLCGEITIDCEPDPCQLPDPQSLTLVVANSSVPCEQIGACVNFLDGTGLGSEYCIDWSWGDGTSQSESAAFCPFHDYSADGTYVVCAEVYCCDNPDQRITLCDEVIIDCGPEPCVLPLASDLQLDLVNTATNCKEVGACLNFPAGIDLSNLCIDWSWGDGLTQSEIAAFCPLHTYACNGTYTVCAQVYCCNDPGNVVEVCGEIVVECPCSINDIPTDADFVLTNTGDCQAEAELILGSTECPNQVCYEFYAVDATVLVTPTANGATFTFPSSGTYQVCLLVHCCDDNTVGYSLCKEISVQCEDPCTLPLESDLVLDLVNTGTNCKEVGACLNFPAGTDLSKLCIDWSWGDGTSQSEIAAFCPLHTYTCNGTYTVCAKVYCCDDPDNAVEICREVVIDCPCDINDLPTDVDWTYNTDGCTVSTDILFSQQAQCPNDICYDWYTIPAGAAIITDFGTGASLEFQASGTYTICLNVHCCGDPETGYSICKEVSVECGCGVEANFSTQPDECSVLFQDLSTIPAGAVSVTYDWNFGDGSNANIPNPLHTYAVGGNYVVCLTVTAVLADGTVCTDTICEEIFVDCNDCDVFVMFTCDPAGCTINFADQSTTGGGNVIVGWFWDFGDGNTSTAQNPTHTYGASGSYTICLTVTVLQPDGTTCSKTFCNTTPFLDCDQCNVFADFSATPDLCDIQFNDLTFTGPGTNITSWFWNFGNGTSSNLQNPSVTYAASGTYTVCLTVTAINSTGNTCTSFRCIPITVDCEGPEPCPEPCELHPAFIYNLLPVTQANGCCVDFFNLSSAGAFTTITGYQWDFGDGNTSTAVDPSHCYPTPGTYTVCLTITGTSLEGDCSQTFCWELTCEIEDTCPSDTNGDGQVGTADLLQLLGSFNGLCP